MAPKRIRQTRARDSGRRAKRQVKRELLGGQFTPSADPPSVVVRPWKAQTIVVSGVGTKTFKDSDIVSAIQTQNSISVADGFVVVFRVRMVRVWQEVPYTSTDKLPAPLKAPITLYAHSIVGEGDQQIVSDLAGSETRYARIGYRWPISQSNATLTALGSDLVFTVKPTSVVENWVVYLDLIWTVQEKSEVADELDGHLLAIGDISISPSQLTARPSL